MKLKFKTNGTFTDITSEIKLVVENKKIKNGFCVIYSTHTTCAVAIMENESLLKKDIEGFLERIAPKCGIYAHDDIEKRDVPPDERINGFSHIRSMLFPTSVVIPIENEKLVLGKWQCLFLLELDPMRERTIYVGTFKA